MYTSMSKINFSGTHVLQWFSCMGPMHAVFWQEINTKRGLGGGGGVFCSNHLYIYHHNQQSKPRPESLFGGLHGTIFLL